MTRFVRTAAVAAALAAATAAHATLYTGEGGVIPDFSGGEPGVFHSEFVLTDSFLIADITVSLIDLNHSWSGDLVVTIQHLESGASQTLFSRVGKTNPLTGPGDSSNFGGTYVFNDAFTGDLWAAAEAGGTAYTIPGGEYFASGPLSPAPVSLLDVFGGLNAYGTWRLTISDNAGFDSGTIGSWSVNFVKAPIPAPGVLAMFAVAGLGCSRRRRR